MKIRRIIDGETHTFSLTEKELQEASAEYDHNCDVQDVKYRLEKMTDEDFKKYGLKKDFVETLVDEIADEKSRNVNDYGMNWEDALDDAFATILSEYSVDEEEDDEDE